MAILLAQESQQFINCGINSESRTKHTGFYTHFLAEFQNIYNLANSHPQMFSPFLYTATRDRIIQRKSLSIRELAYSCYLSQQHSLKINHSDKGMSHIYFYETMILDRYSFVNNILATSDLLLIFCRISTNIFL